MSGFQLPARASRGKRMRAVMEEEEEGADAEFWNQSFFAEEEVDEDYQAPAVEEEDVVDSDFDEPEDEDDDEDGEEGVERPKRKTLKAPEPKAPPKPKAPKQPKTEPTGDEPAPKSRARQVQEEQEPVVIAVPTLRRSTMARVAQAERVRQDKVRPARARPSKASDWRPMSQAELLQEAARTEVDNLHSLRQLLAMEEETKKKATIIKQVYRGPVVKWVSRRKLLPNAPPAFPTIATPAAPVQAAPVVATAAPVVPPATATPAAATAAPAPAAAVSSGVASLASASSPVPLGTSINATPTHLPALDANAPGPMDVTPSHPSPAPTSDIAGAAETAASPAPDVSHATATPLTALVPEANGQVSGMTQGPGASAAPAAPSQPQQAVQGEGAAAGQSQQQPSQPQTAAADGSAGGQQQQQQPNKNQNHYEGTLVYELHNMNYPPVWLRRWKAPAPPAPTLCIVTSAPARYRDPATRVGYSNAAAFRRLRGLPAVPPPIRPPPPPPPTGRGFNTGSTCLFAGVGSRQALGANALKALAALPPEPQPPPPPSLQQAQVPPMSLAPPMMAMVLEIAQSLR